MSQFSDLMLLILSKRQKAYRERQRARKAGLLISENSARRRDTRGSNLENPMKRTAKTRSTLAYTESRTH